MILLTERQAAQMLGLAPSTLKKWRWSGRGPAFTKLGAAVRYAPDRLHEYAAAHTSGGKD
jgi:predicted site-specific integrase-resolvase